MKIHVVYPSKVYSPDGVSLNVDAEVADILAEALLAKAIEAIEAAPAAAVKSPNRETRDAYIGKALAMLLAYSALRAEIDEAEKNGETVSTEPQTP